MKNRPCKILGSWFLFLHILLLSGCWDRSEVNQLAMVTAIGIDQKEEHRIELSVQVIVPRAIMGGGGGLGMEQKSSQG